MNLFRRRISTPMRILGIALTAIALLLGAAIPAGAAEMMRVTFVRHGESQGNATGLIDTSTPGPVLTEKGQQQARDLVDKLGDNNYDAIYASTMVRTQLTAAPMSQYLRLPIQVLPGLQEIEAGRFEGTPESEAANGYAKFPLAWVFQGNTALQIPGSITGDQFNERVDGALQTMYDNGDRNAIVFSHGGTIMFWTLMNAKNLDMAQKLDLLRTAPLNNTDYVVIEGNPEDGWTLVNWNGKEFSPEPTLGAEVQLQSRTLSRQLRAAADQVSAAFASRDLPTIVTALSRGISDASFSVDKFRRAVTAKVVREVQNSAPQETQTQSSDASIAAAPQTVKTTATNLVQEVTEKAEAALPSVKSRVPSLRALDGNASGATKPAVATVRPGQRLQNTLKDVGERATTGVRKLGDVVKKITEGATAGTHGAGAAGDSSPAGDAADGGSDGQDNAA